jgi:hypothetical protein
MAYNVSGWGTVAPNQIGYWVGYQFGPPGQGTGPDEGAQFAQAKPEGGVMDGTQNGSLTSYNHNIYLDVESQGIAYSFLVDNTSDQDLSFMLCGGGLS